MSKADLTLDDLEVGKFYRFVVKTPHLSTPHEVIVGKVVDLIYRNTILVAGYQKKYKSTEWEWSRWEYIAHDRITKITKPKKIYIPGMEVT